MVDECTWPSKKLYNIINVELKSEFHKVFRNFGFQWKVEPNMCLSLNPLKLDYSVSYSHAFLLGFSFVDKYR